ncbi:hypothetical protein M2282_003555 [Variovorax boronicumulans]|uniref:DUF3540 domain-containing protein n=1 Tax=Variovorax boronicumulans TaxID=436515 RepID=UPI0024741354|nr:DUF3540 domain-containing protein [Variovorax boronicumulans]MDH6168402.1 hypothetical protein [Variovorax boronicumulans]
MNVVPLRPALAAAATPVHCTGRLTATLPDAHFDVEGEDGQSWRCRRAASCLLRPEVGDTVLLSGPDRHRVYLIAVLEQADATVSRIETAGVLSIESPGDVRLHSGGQLQMKAAQWNLQAATGQCRVDDLRFTGQVLDATVGKLRLVGRVFESVADRIVQMARNALRVVDETEQVRVGHLDCEASGTARLHARHTVVTASDLVKVDAAQIHMG